MTTDQTTIHVSIAVTAPTAENATQWATTVSDLVQAEYGDTMRLAFRVSPPAATPAVPSATVDRAAILRWAADELDRYVGHQSSDAAPEVEGARLVIRELRRIAGQSSPVDAGKCGCHSPSGAYRCTQPAGHLGYHRHTRPDTDEWSSWVTSAEEQDPSRMAAEAQQPETPAAGWHLTREHLDLFVRALVNEVDYDIHKNYECGEEDGEDHYPELVAEAAEMLDAITAATPDVEARKADTAGEQQ